MFKIFKKNKKEFISPLSGKLVSLSEVDDEVFSQEMLGTGFAIVPEDGSVYSPVTGKVTAVFPSGHAIGITTDDKLDVLIHIGINTVELNGEGFQVMCKQGDFVQAGDLLVNTNLKEIISKGKDPICMIIFPNREVIEINKLHENVVSLQKDIIKIN